MEGIGRPLGLWVEGRSEGVDWRPPHREMKAMWLN